MRLLGVLLIWAGTVLGQTNLPTPAVIPPRADDSGTGELRFREKRANGSSYVGFRAPASIPESIIWTLPDADGEAGKCWGFGATATLGWVDCAGGGGAGDLPVVDTTAIVKGSADPTKQIRFEVDTLLPTATTVVLTVPGEDVTLMGRENTETISGTKSFTQSMTVGTGGSTRGITVGAAGHLGSYVNAQSFEIRDAGGGWSNFGSISATASTFSKVLTFTDYASQPIFQLVRQEVWVEKREARFDLSLIPLNPEVNNLTLGSSTLRWNKLWVKDIDISGTCTGCGGGDLPVVDTTAIAKGSTDATKQVRFEVDTAVPTGTTVVLTVPDQDVTLVGVENPQTITGVKTFTESIEVGTGGNQRGITVGAPGRLQSFVNAQQFEIRDAGGGQNNFGSISGVASTFSKVLTFTDYNSEAILQLVRQEVWVEKREARFALSLMPMATVTYDVGATGMRWKKLWVQDIDFSGTLTGTIPPPANMVTTDTVQTITGHKTFNSFSVGQVMSNLTPSATATFGLGVSSARWLQLYAVSGDFSGSVSVATSSSGSAVSAVNSGTGGGIFGWAQGSGTGVLGISYTGYGLSGTSSSSYGVYGSSGTSYGGYFAGAAGGIYAAGSGAVAIYAAGSILSTGAIAAVGGITASGGFSAGGSQGWTHMATVRRGDNSGACYLWFTGGIITGSTCN